MIKYISSFIVGLLAMLLSASPAFAVATPSFPTCTNPQGSIKVQYSSGLHGIPGDTSEHRGSDTVYTLSDTTLMQCFCGEDSNGIQTNWWNASTLSENDIEILKRDGFVYIPNGSLWGLAQAPYVAKNNNYSCGKDGNVLTANTEDPGAVLANTGNTMILYGLTYFGILFLLIWVALRKRT